MSGYIIGLEEAHDSGGAQEIPGNLTKQRAPRLAAVFSYAPSVLSDQWMGVSVGAPHVTAV
jgi:hypothetical protein